MKTRRRAGSADGVPRVKREPARKLAKRLAKDQSAAVQPGLQGLRLHAKHAAGFLRRHALDIAQDNGNAIDLRKLGDSLDQALAHFTPEHMIIGERRLVGRVLRRRTRLFYRARVV